MRLSQKLRKASFPLRAWANRLTRPCATSGGPPSGIFSESQVLRDHAANGRIVSEGQLLPAIPADSEIVAAGLDQHRHSDWTALWTQRCPAFLAAPSLAHLDASDRVCHEAVYGPHAWADPVWSRHQPRPIRELAGDHTSIVSRWNDGRNYFHWFLDGLTRLVHLRDFPPGCRIIVPARLPAFARRSLEILGLGDRIVETEHEDLIVERYWFAGPTMLSGCPDPLGVSWLRKHFLHGPEPERRRLLYVERKAPTRNASNAAEVRRLFKARGWETLDPGEHPLDEQIRIFREARAVAGIHGASLTNLLWTRPGTKVLELMPSRRRNGCYAGISLAAGLNHHTLVCPSNRHADITVPVRELSNLLDSNYQEL